MMKLKSKRGFTLIELMIVVVIVGIMAAMAAPRFTTTWERWNFRTGAREVSSKIRSARSMALATKFPHGVYFNTDSLTYTLFEDKINLDDPQFEIGDSVISVDTLPRDFNLMVTDCRNDCIMFNANGSATFDGGGNVGVMLSTENTLSFAVHDVLAATGRVRTTTNHY